MQSANYRQFAASFINMLYYSTFCEKIIGKIAILIVGKELIAEKSEITAENQVFDMLKKD